MLLVRSYRSVDRTLSEGLSDRNELVLELGGLVMDCRDRDRIFELVALVHVPVLVALSDVSGREGEGPGEYDEVESLARFARKEEGAWISAPVRFPTTRGKVECDEAEEMKAVTHMEDPQARQTLREDSSDLGESCPPHLPFASLL